MIERFPFKFGGYIRSLFPTDKDFWKIVPDAPLVPEFRVITLKWVSFIATHIVFYPTPKFLNYFWSFGSLLGLGLVIQIITGIVLAKHYTANIEYAFFSVEHIMRDVNYGYIIRYTHSNGSSMLFILLYLHMFRGIFYGSFFNKMLLWWSGIVLFLLMMGTAFLGYVLPWGQMSFWGATVITNLASAVPLVGESIVQWLWGGFSISNATLVRFFAYHYALPFVILGLVILHLAFLHDSGSSNSLGTSSGAYIPFYPYFYVKDLLAFLCYILCLSFLVFFLPNLLGHPDNYILANPMVTPAHIVPEWYFLPFYAILRSIPNKLLGVFGMIFAILILALFPVFKTNFTVKSGLFRPGFQNAFYFFVATFILLGWLGQKSATPSIVLLAQQCTALYFLLILFMIFLPIIERWRSVILDRIRYWITFFSLKFSQLYTFFYALFLIIGAVSICVIHDVYAKFARPFYRIFWGVIYLFFPRPETYKPFLKKVNEDLIKSN